MHIDSRSNLTASCVIQHNSGVLTHFVHSVNSEISLGHPVMHLFCTILPAIIQAAWEEVRKECTDVGTHAVTLTL